MTRKWIQWINQNLSWLIMNYFAARERDKLLLWKTFSCEAYCIVPWNLLSATILFPMKLGADGRPELQDDRQSCLHMKRTCKTGIMGRIFLANNTPPTRASTSEKSWRGGQGSLENVGFHGSEFQLLGHRQMPFLLWHIRSPADSIDYGPKHGP